MKRPAQTLANCKALGIGETPLIITCSDCERKFTSKYARKVHVCRLKD